MDESVGEWVHTARRLVELEAKVPAILKGEATPGDASERLALAHVCYKTGRHATSARFADEAFAETPAAPARTWLRASATMPPARPSLAGSGPTRDDPPPDEPDRAKLREKALAWLRADLSSWAKILEGGDEAARMKIVPKLAYWKIDADLAGIRDEAALAKLTDGEQEGFRALWADVDQLLAKARAGAP